VLLVFQLGQPRIWLTMSRDGLLPPVFARVHPRFHTPSCSTLLTGLLVGVPALFLDMNLVVDLTSIGTLFAFALVCGGILVLDPHGTSAARFTVPYLNGRWLVPLLVLAGLGYYYHAGRGGSADVVLQLPYLVFGLAALALAVVTFRRRLSLLPVLGLLINFYLLTQLGLRNWVMFLAWLLLGLGIYVGYGYRHSRLGSRPPGP